MNWLCNIGSFIRSKWWSNRSFAKSCVKLCELFGNISCKFCPMKWKNVRFSMVSNWNCRNLFLFCLNVGCLVCDGMQLSLNQISNGKSTGRHSKVEVELANQTKDQNEQMNQTKNHADKKRTRQYEERLKPKKGKKNTMKRTGAIYVIKTLNSCRELFLRYVFVLRIYASYCFFSNWSLSSFIRQRRGRRLLLLMLLLL